MKFEFNPTVDKIGDVPSDFRALYEAGSGDNEGKFTLKGDDFSKAAISAVVGLNTALKASRAEAIDLKTKKSVDLSALKSYGETPEAVAEKFTEMLTEAGKGKKSQEEIERQVSKIKTDLATEYEVKLTTAKNEKQTLRDQLYSHLVTSEAKTALAEAGAIDSSLALPFIQQQVKVTEADDGKFLVHVVDQTGDTRYSGATSSPMAVKELVAEMKGQDKYGPLFKSEALSGGAVKPNEQHRKPNTSGEEKTSQQKIADGIAARRKNRG